MAAGSGPCWLTRKSASKTSAMLFCARKRFHTLPVNAWEGSRVAWRERPQTS